MNFSTQASLSITISLSFLRLIFIESVMPSNHPILCHPLLPRSIFPSIRVFPHESVLCIRWPKYWSFNFSISLSNEYSGLVSFRIDWVDLLAVQRVSRVFSNTTVNPINSIKRFMVGICLSVSGTASFPRWPNHLAFPTARFIV